MLKICCFLFILSLIAHATLGQKKDSTYVGEVMGIVNDSIHNFVLQSASIAVYRSTDNTLISYQLSNNLGAFHFKKLPVGVSLKIVISYTGYKNLTKKFSIPVDKKKMDLNKLTLISADGELESVVVEYTPPVQMNGDTLEFNADAFILDSNAVVQDLLRKLPGVTIWGDGEITVNGKKVNSVLVDGKPFFGGDTRVAIQNLPKNAIDKIQVYQQKNGLNPYDSITNLNIKLKANKKFGYFGKLGGGYGTDERYEANVSLNIFSPRTQFAWVAAQNNINKSAYDINTLMLNASFKGPEISVEYQPDFRSPGLNRPRSGGFIFQHDFIPDAGYEKDNRFNANYFVNDNNVTTQSNTQTTTSLGGTNLIQKNNYETGNRSIHHYFNPAYRFSNSKRQLTISPTINVANSTSHSLQQSSSAGESGALQSATNSYSENNDHAKNLSFSADYTNRNSNTNSEHHSMNYTINYTFYAGSSHNLRSNKTDFISLADASQNKKYDRRYDKNSDDISHALDIAITDFKGLLFKYKTPLGLNFQIQNSLKIKRHNEDNTVVDKDTLSMNYHLNNNLTNNSAYHTLDEMPGLNLSKTFTNSLAYRYLKSFSINFLGQGQFYKQVNSSQHFFQNFKHSYSKFIPSVHARYSNAQFGEYQNSYSLDFSTSFIYPTPNQLVPLTDSAQVWFIQKGNPNLKPASRKTLSFNFNHQKLGSKNPLNYSLSISAGFIRNHMADSSIYDNVGRNIHYTANTDGKKFMSGGAHLTKAFQFKAHQLQISANINLNTAKDFIYINSQLYSSYSFNNSSNLNLRFTLKDILSINVEESLSIFRTEQKGVTHNVFKNSTSYTRLNVHANFTKRLSLASDIGYNKNTFTDSEAINFTIWNANLSYRFLKGNNAELKFWALDLLHQNTTIIHSGGNNYISRGTINNLQQYFMVSLSYFPRNFGKKAKN